MHLFVIAGHGAGDPGAGGNGWEEAERVRALAQRIAELGGENVTLADIDRNWYADAGILGLDLPEDWQVVELHMDAAGETAHGGHVIYCGSLVPDEYDWKLSEFIASMFPGRNNALVGRTDLANPNRAAAMGINYRLIENGFITNANDVEIFNSRMDELARGYLDVFGIPVVGGSATIINENEEGGSMACIIEQNDGDNLYYFNGDRIIEIDKEERDVFDGISWTSYGCPLPVAHMDGWQVERAQMALTR